MKIAFIISEGAEWTGGLNYLKNLASTVREFCGDELSVVMVYPPNAQPATVAALQDASDELPIHLTRSPDPLRIRSMYRYLVKDFEIEQALKQRPVDAVFLTGVWLGPRFPLPTLAWIPDFQYRHLPQMFSRFTKLKRRIGHALLSRFSTRVMLSSHDAQADCLHYLPSAKGKTVALPFCVGLPRDLSQDAIARVRKDYSLPEAFIYLPNQLWRHKNHKNVIQALHLLNLQSKNVHVIATGNPHDYRNPDYPASVFDLVSQLGLKENFRFLGLVPYGDIVPLMRASAAVINPSLFEGWSTTVEEAKAIGAPLLLSSIGVHKEQAPSDARFFDPLDIESIADAMFFAVSNPILGDARQKREQQAVASYASQRAAFAARFVEIVKSLAR